MNNSNEINIKIFYKILTTVVKMFGLKGLKPFYYWSLALSLNRNERYCLGDLSLCGIHKEFFIRQHGKYGYEVFKCLKKNTIFFEETDEKDVLRAKPPEKITKMFGLLLDALEYKTVTCEFGLTNFKRAAVVSMLGSSMKKELAKLLGYTPQTISNLLRIRTKTIELAKKVWTIIKPVNREDLDLDKCSLIDDTWCSAWKIWEDIMYNDKVPNPV